MGVLSVERLKRFEDTSYLYYDWVSVLADAGITDIQDLQGQLLLKCPFHEDKRPSFRIRLHEHNYHCFSCNDFGSVVKLMYKLSSQSVSKSVYYEQLLKSNPAMQRELGFNSLFIEAGTLDEGFNTRRRFSAKGHIGSGMPISVALQRVRSVGDTWENLVYSLTMLQAGESPENVVDNVTSLSGSRVKVGDSGSSVSTNSTSISNSSDKISVMSLIEGVIDD